MKRIFIIIALIAICMLVMAQREQLIWVNGNLIGISTEIADSLAYREVEEVDTFHLLLPRTNIEVEHDTVYIRDTTYIEVPFTPGEEAILIEENKNLPTDLDKSARWLTSNSEPIKYNENTNLVLSM